MRPFLPGLDDDVPLQLDEELLAVDLVEVVPGVGTPDHHGEEVATAIEVLVSDGGLKVRVVRGRPIHEMERAADRAIGFEPVWLQWGLGVGSGACGIGRGGRHGWSPKQAIPGAEDFRPPERRFIPTVQGNDHTGFDASPFHRVPSHR